MNRIKIVFFLSNLALFTACVKNDINHSLQAGNTETALARNAHPPVVIETPGTDFFVIDANTGFDLYNKQVDNDRQDLAHTQSPLIIGDVIINFYAGTVTASYIKDNTVKWKINVVKAAGNLSPEAISPNSNDGDDFTSYPVLVDNILMFVLLKVHRSGSGVYAIDVNTGSLLWYNNDYTVSDRSIPTYAKGLLLVNGDAYYGGGGGYFYAINIKTGKTKWVDENYGSLSAPCTDSENVYFAKIQYTNTQHSNDSLISLRVIDGSVNWARRTDYITTYQSYPLVSNNHLYTFTEDTFTCRNKENGQPIWQFKALGELVYFTAPITNNGNVYVSTAGYDSSNVYAFKESNGQQLWNARISIGGVLFFYEGPVVMHNTVYQRGFPGYLSAFDKNTGEQVFERQVLKPYEGDMRYGPAFLDENNVQYFPGASGMR